MRYVKVELTLKKIIFKGLSEHIMHCRSGGDISTLLIHNLKVAIVSTSQYAKGSCLQIEEYNLLSLLEKVR